MDMEQNQNQNQGSQPAPAPQPTQAEATQQAASDASQPVPDAQESAQNAPQPVPDTPQPVPDTPQPVLPVSGTAPQGGAPWQVPQQQPPLDDGQGFSIAALVCGILGIVGGFIPVVKYFTTVLAILGLVFGFIGRKKSTEARGSASGMATAGLILGILGVVGAILGLVCDAACSCVSCVFS